METALDCFPCFLRQALFAGRTAGADPETLATIVREAAAMLPGLDRSKSPPENAAPLYRMISRLTGNADPFAPLKAASNQEAATLVQAMRPRLAAHDDPLRAALALAIAGNVMDYGSQHDLDPGDMLARCLDTSLAIDDTETLRADLDAARSVLLLADNCGEIVFDAFFLEQLAGKTRWLAVKERPVINDATVTDALALGLDRFATVISNGTDIPGTVLDACSPTFREIFATADVVISKGQGNFETLSDTNRPIYFLLTVKCPVVAAHLADRTGLHLPTGAMILAKNRWHTSEANGK